MAVEDFTTWTESDAGGYLTVASDSVTWTDLPRDADDHWIQKSHSEAGDFTHRFQYTTPASGDIPDGSWVYPWYLSTLLDEPNAVESGGGDACTWYIAGQAAQFVSVLRLVEAGTPADYEISVALAYETTYYIEVTRDDDAGANSTGQVVMTISTGNYAGDGGDTLVDTLTVDAAASQQNDYSYIMVAVPRGASPSTAQSGEISNLDLGEAAPSYQDAEGTFAIAISFSGTAEAGAAASYQDAEGTFAIALTFVGTGTIVSGTISGGPGTQTKRRLVAIGNNVLYYEDI